jgi:hypothetical protein
MLNLPTKAAKSAQNLVFTFVGSIFAQHNPKDFWAQHGRIVEQMEKPFNKATKDILVFTSFPN